MTDPQAKKPRRPPSAYQLFCSQNLPKLRAQRPEESHQTRKRLLKEQWGHMNEESKKQFQEEHKRQMSDYKVRVQRYGQQC